MQVDHILVETKAEADEVYAQVTAPGDGAGLRGPREAGLDRPGAKQNSGSLGSAVASTYVPPFAAAVIALEPGEVSKPVKTQFGWHVIHLVDKDVQSFEEVKRQLLEPARPRFRHVARRAGVEAAVDVNPRYGRFDAETLRSRASRAPSPSDAHAVVALRPPPR